jgi:hypothetical protein
MAKYTGKSKTLNRDGPFYAWTPLGHRYLAKIKTIGNVSSMLESPISFCSRAMHLTSDQILALAPDAASAKAGSAQSSAAKWSGLGGHAQALWGLCQGSGKEPYRAQIDLAGPAFKCSCPSRKFPCKHGLGLFLLFARDAQAFADATAPAWVNDWLQSRAQRSEKNATKAQELTPENSAAKAQRQQKTQDKRAGNVEAGLAILDTWLADLAQGGLAGLRSKPAQDWEAMAARLVDTQASGLATRLRRAGMLIYGSSSSGWETAVARELGQLALLSQSYRRLATLPTPLQHDIKSAIGWAVSQDDVLLEPGVPDHWQVFGNHTDNDARIGRRTCYLRGRDSGRWAMLLQFSAGGQALPPPLLPGAWYHGTLHYYPGAAPLRAVFGADVQMTPETSMPQAPALDVAALLLHYAQALAANPFLDTFPMQLDGVVPQVDGGRWSLRAPDGALIPVQDGFRQGWQLHAVAGGAPANVFGVWNGIAYLPLSVACGQRLYVLDGASPP